jgi:hypothetical protein
MNFNQPSSEIWIPDGAPENEVFGRVTHMSIGAHQDDVEIMALDGILAGLEKRGFIDKSRLFLFQPAYELHLLVTVVRIASGAWAARTVGGNH